MHRGYIKLWRKIRDSWLLTDPHALSLLIILLLNAEWKDGRKILFKGKQRELKAGQLTAGRKQLSKWCGLSQRSTRTAIEKLKTTNMLTTETTNHFTLFSIVNFTQYQGESTSQTTSGATNDRPATDQQPTTLEAFNHPSIQEDIKDSAEPILIKDQKPTRVDLKDVKLFDFKEGAKHKLYNQMIGIFDVRGWRTDPEFVKTVFVKVCGSMNGVKPSQPYPYFQKTLANYLNQHSEEISKASRRTR